jgi:AraC-like DNA-binding protein
LNKPQVLLVEDDLIHALYIKKILDDNGYDTISNIVTVEDAIIAIEAFTPNLVLIDINLKQDKDGIEVGKYLLQKDTIPFIYITSSSDKATIDRARDTRPSAYMVKPFKVEDLEVTVAIVINNFKHKNIDVLRYEKEIISNIPFVLKQTINYIDENITEKIKISDLARQTKWESQHFNRLFAKYLGVTPYKYIMDKKIDKAKILITETNIPITQISFELGIKSHSNFCSIFKKHTGKTPENFRKWHELNKLIH